MAVKTYGGFNSPGLGNVGSYQVAAIPFMTGSDMPNAGKERKIIFPSVTRSITVVNTGSTETPIIRVHFDSMYKSSVFKNRQYFELTAKKDSVTMNIKCKEVYISSQEANSGFMIFAELTNIPTGSMYTLTGSGINKEPDV